MCLHIQSENWASVIQIHVFAKDLQFADDSQGEPTKLTFKYWKSPIKTLDNGVKYVQS